MIPPAKPAPSENGTPHPPRPESRCPIIFEDQALLVINKPSGILSHPNRNGKKGRVAFEGRYHEKDRRFDTPAGSIWLIHRLDEDTSGILIAAKNQPVAEKLREMFESLEVRKNYVAWIKGSPKPTKGKWQDHLQKEIGPRGVRSIILKGRPPNSALTYQVIQEFQKPIGMDRKVRISIIDIYPETGRTHQIRVQFASRGHPLLGDDVYGDYQLNRELRKGWGIKRLCLHAKGIEFKHPATGKPIVIHARIPAELAAPEPLQGHEKM